MGTRAYYSKELLLNLKGGIAFKSNSYQKENNGSKSFPLAKKSFNLIKVVINLKPLTYSIPGPELVPFQIYTWFSNIYMVVG